MANICSTQIRFFGNDDALTDFFNRIEHAVSDEAHPDMSYCERRSFRNIANEFGIDPDKVSLRGEIEYDRDCATIYTETAWTPRLGIWSAIIEKCYSDEDGNPLIYFDWIAEEFGCDIYCTNNMEEFGDRSYCVDFEIGNYSDYIYGRDEHAVLGKINWTLEAENVETVKTLAEAESVIENHDNWFISVHKLEEVDTYYFD